MYTKRLNKKLPLFFLSLASSFSLYAQDPAKSPGSNFDLSAWKLQTLNEKDNSFLEIKDSNELKEHESDFFYTDSTDGAMVFKCPSNGGTTSAGTKYPRVELRQMREGANWSLSDSNEHYLTAQCKVMEVAQVKPKTIIGQIHGSESNSEMLKIRWTGYKTGECFVEARFQTNDDEGSEYGVKLTEGLSLGDLIQYSVTMKEGTVSVTVNDKTASQTYTSQFYGTTDKYYFKAGNYIQWNNEIVDAPPTVNGVNKFLKLSLRKEIQTDVFNNKIVTANRFNIFPNPVIDFVYLHWNSRIESNIIVKIFDSSACIRKELAVRKGQLQNEGNLKIGLDKLSPGLYFIQLSSERYIETKKLLIIK